MPTKRDYYDILGISKSAGDAEIKRAYRKLALEWHPDRNKSPNANEKFKEINEAYAVLSNKDKRAAYDQFGHSAFTPGGGMGGGFRQQGPFATYTYTTSGGMPGGMPFGDDFFDPFEIFEQFFGGGFSAGGGGHRRAHPAYEITIDFMEAVRGVTKEVMVPRGGAGEGSVRKTIKIPAGVDTGSKIRFDDFDVMVEVRPSRTFHREGYDVVVTHEIPFVKAALGGIEEVETIDKPVKIRIPAGIQPGTLIRLRGQGIPHVRGGGRGDEYVKIQLKIPTHVTREQRELLEKLDKTM